MKLTYSLWAILLAFTANHSYSQLAISPEKKIIGFDDIEKWNVIVNQPVISPDGNYLLVRERINKEQDRLVVKSANGIVERTIENASSAVFLRNENKFVYRATGDTLVLADIKQTILIIPDVSSFELIKSQDREFLIYRTSGTLGLGIAGLPEMQPVFFPNISDYLLSNDKESILMTSKEGLRLYDTKKKKNTEIYHGEGVSGMIFNGSGDRVAFSVQDKKKNVIMIYRKGDRSSSLLLDEVQDLPIGYRVEKLDNFLCRFGYNNNQLFFNVRSPKKAEVKDSLLLNLWSYTDIIPQSQQLKFGPAKTNGTVLSAVVSMKAKDIYIAEEDQLLIDFTENVVIAAKNKQIGGFTSGEGIFNSALEGGVVQINLKERKKQKFLNDLFMPCSTCPYFSAEPSDSQFQPLQDSVGNLWMLNRTTGKIREVLRKSVVETFGKPVYFRVFSEKPAQKGLFLVNDGFDIWLVDAAKVKPAINITNGFGRRNNYRFYPMLSQGTLVEVGDRILFRAVNQKNWQNGIAAVEKFPGKDPEVTMLGDYQLDRTILKASKANVILFNRVSDYDMGNYYLTPDLITYKPITDVHPEKSYNWYTSELFDFQRMDGKMDQAILYRPQHFDPGKKYPVIMLYYHAGGVSILANRYHVPKLMHGGEVDIPWFVSRGYLVCRVNCLDEPGDYLNSALKSVNGAVGYLKKLPFVDVKRIALSGHSFGGGQTNYILGHSEIFRAALSGAATSNLTNGYSTVRGINYVGALNQGFYEMGQYYMKVNLWENPAKYIYNSPIFYADKVNTPVLMMHNNRDASVDFNQGVQFFSALRRLGKKAWMLSYEGEGHTLGGELAKKDFTLRVTQFFDFYLKDAPAPLWMLDGIPVSKKGIDNGLALDTLGRTPGNGILTEREREKVEAYSKIPLKDKLR